MTLLIFGAAGFVGRNLVNLLLEKKEQIIATDVTDNPFAATVPYVKLDVLDRSKVADVAKKSDTIIHLAASPLTVSLQDPATNMRINIEGTLNILDAARKHGVKKVVYSSASSVVGDVTHDARSFVTRVSEDLPCSPKTPYAVAKKACEDYLRVYSAIFGLNYLVFRFFNVYGPGQRSGLIPNIYSALAGGKTFTVQGDGSSVRDFIYVGDVAEFCYSAVKLPDVKNTVVNLGTGLGTSIKEALSVASEILHVTPQIAYQPARPGEIGNFVADTTRIKQLFGKTPSTTLREGLEETFSWLGKSA